tara:strand:+ start:3284 stop:3655 length:372 start_codon:yes stop_codon:yes gene_type:complete
MELETNSKSLPLLTDSDSYSDINSIAILDKLKCVSYREVYIKKKILGRNTICSHDHVRIIQDDAYVIPNEFVYTKNSKNYMSGDYISVLLLDSMKKLRDENKHLKNTLNKLQTRINRLEKYYK